VTLKLLFKGVTFAALLAIAGTLLSSEWPDEPGRWAVFVFLLGWIGGPLVLPYLLSRSDNGALVRLPFLIVFLFEIAFTAWMLNSVLSSTSSTAGIGFLVLPLLAWGGLMVAACAIGGVSGWRPLSEEDSHAQLQSPPPA
jgi:hypothetical protein